MKIFRRNYNKICMSKEGIITEQEWFAQGDEGKRVKNRGSVVVTDDAAKLGLLAEEREQRLKLATKDRVITLDDGKTKITVPSVAPLKESKPKLKLIDTEKPKVRAEWIARVANMEEINPNELVHLTVSAVSSRLKVFLHTSSDFCEEGPLAATTVTKLAMPVELANVLGSDIPITSQFNRRLPTPINEMLAKLREIGFEFVDDGQKIVMLVDVTIPAKENTNGRYAGHSEIQVEERGENSITTGQRLKSVGAGCRPLTPGSKEAIAIPVEKLIKLHQGRPPLSTWHFSSDQAFPWYYSMAKDGLLNSRHRNNRAEFEQMYDNILTFFRQQKAEVEQFLAVNRVRPSREQKVAFFQYLTEKLKLQARPANDGYFPNEPTFVFEDEANSLESVGADYLTRINDFSIEEKRRNKRRLPTELFLDELLMLANEALRG